MLAAIILTSAAVAATLAVFRAASTPEQQAQVAATETVSVAATSSSDGQLATRSPQPGFGGALPSAEESQADGSSEQDGGTPSVDSERSTTPPIPTPASVLPGNGVVTVAARSGDTLLAIAAKFNLEVSSLVWSNDISDPAASLGEGTVVRVPHEDGVIHEVTARDTVEAIAEMYEVEPKDITGYAPNGIESSGDLQVGEVLLVPGGVVSDRGRLDEYTVREGDSLTEIASYYGLQPQTLVWANELPDPSLIYAGQVLVIPPGDGALVYAAEGDTVEGIAEQFNVDADDLYDYGFNALGGDAVLQIGQPIMVPGDFLPPLPSESPLGAVPAGQDVEGPSTGTFIWPAEGWVSQEYHSGHLGIDIANEAWTPVNAIDGGVVIFADWSDYGLGYTVGIDHGNGFQTWYGHFAAQPYVEVGQIIWQGGYLGPMGSTGRSTGPHLHLVVIQDGVYVDPLDFLE